MASIKGSQTKDIVEEIICGLDDGIYLVISMQMCSLNMKIFCNL